MPTAVALPPSKCPFTRTVRAVQGLFRGAGSGTTASHLRVQVWRGGEERVNVYLPARSARWMIDLIPEDVLAKIHAEGIPIDRIQAELKAAPVLESRRIFEVEEAGRTVKVWLE